MVVKGEITAGREVVGGEEDAGENGSGWWERKWPVEVEDALVGEGNDW
jgi:hypothetical protein